MKRKNWKPYLFWLLLTEAVGALSGLLTRDGAKAFQAVIRKPPLTPPGIVFPIVWTILFALIGIGAARVYLAPASTQRAQALRLFGVQLIFNFLWPILFFNLQRFGLALVWLLALWVLIGWMALTYRQVDPLAAWLQVPYFIWVTFAVYLNLGVWRLNG